MAKVSPLMIAPPVIFMLLAGVFFVGMQRENPNELPSAFEGREAPVVALEQLAQKPLFEDATLREDGVKLVNFWASWCAPCRVEHPHLTALAEEGITIYGVNYKDNPGNAIGFLEELGDPYAGIGADTTGRMGLDWGLYGVPETYVINGQGEIVLRFAGPITERVMDSEIRPAIERAKN
ncbi:DsbE family thiol:disulfide interchange protein [Roseovarius phycicola]|uniref:DsbE family thiol:disulfide interchange protein n=1 Tax=Roseovarius phycicola TaxID=3080976 RepID=A0ABZ2HCR9_9RHOB